MNALVGYVKELKELCSKIKKTAILISSQIPVEIEFEVGFAKELSKFVDHIDQLGIGHIERLANSYSVAEKWMVNAIENNTPDLVIEKLLYEEYTKEQKDKFKITFLNQLEWIHGGIENGSPLLSLLRAEFTAKYRCVLPYKLYEKAFEHLLEIAKSDFSSSSQKNHGAEEIIDFYVHSLLREIQLIGSYP